MAVPSLGSTWSARTRVLFLAAVAGITAMIVGSLAMYSALISDDAEMLDGRLVALGSVVLSLSMSEVERVRVPEQPGAIVVETDSAFGSLYRYQLWSKDGRLLLRSSKAPDDGPFGPLKAQGFSTIASAGERLRLLTLPSANGAVLLQIAQCLDDRDIDVAMVSKRYLAFLTLPFLLIGFVAQRQLRAPLRMLSSLVDQVRQRGPLNLARIETEATPPEFAPMLNAINTLFQRVERTLTAERSFASMAAHELRLPLSGLRAQAQLAMASRSRGEVMQALAEVMKAVDSAARTIDQLLDLARVDELRVDGALDPRRTVDLGKVVEHEVRQIQGLCERRGITIDMALSRDHTAVLGHESALTLLVGNLLSNAAKYAPAGGRVRVSLTTGAGAAIVLSVEDSGPGIAPDRRSEAFERFNRLGRRDATGVGLGLSIVRTVAELHGAEVDLADSDLGGLRADVTFRGRAAQAQPGFAQLGTRTSG